MVEMREFNYEHILFSHAIHLFSNDIKLVFKRYVSSKFNNISVKFQ